MHLSRDEIMAAIKCETWQSVRVSLKGQTTMMKIIDLEFWHRFGGNCDCSRKTRSVQVINYLNALSRGGLIDPIVGDTVSQVFGNVKVRR